MENTKDIAEKVVDGIIEDVSKQENNDVKVEEQETVIVEEPDNEEPVAEKEEPVVEEQTVEEQVVCVFV